MLEPAITPALAAGAPGRSLDRVSAEATVSVLTGCADKPYSLGLASALMAKGCPMDFIGSDYVDGPELHGTPLVNFLNFRGDQRPEASRVTKVARVLKYYVKLMAYAAKARPKVFHILWHNRFDFLDRTLVLFYYKLLGKKLVFTAHNVNGAARDAIDSPLNRLSLRIQYRLFDHIFIHTNKMKEELCRDFGVPESKATVIPFGINNTLPQTALTGAEARKRLGFNPNDKVVLFFGNIAPYKGVEYLVEAWSELASKYPELRLIIAGRPKGQDADYWNRIHQTMAQGGWGGRVLEKIEYVTEEYAEGLFKAADVLILPYTYIFQSGVLSLGYSYGLPVIVSDVGSLKEDVVEGETGFVFEAKNSVDLARTLQKYFQSDLFKELEQRRARIKEYANQRYSWSEVAAITTARYAKLLE